MAGTVRAAYLVGLTVLLVTDVPWQAAQRCRLPPLHWQSACAAGHVLAFLVLGWMALSVQRIVPWRWVLAGLAAFAGGVECAQGLVPHRVADPMDFLLNLSGIAVATAICRPWAGSEPWAPVAGRTDRAADQPAQPALLRRKAA
jgi:VanZ family protein